MSDDGNERFTELLHGHMANTDLVYFMSPVQRERYGKADPIEQYWIKYSVASVLAQQDLNDEIDRSQWERVEAMRE
jgi:hypothetical protein